MMLYWIKYIELYVINPDSQAADVEESHKENLNNESQLKKQLCKKEI